MRKTAFFKTALLMFVLLLTVRLTLAQASEDKARFAAEQWIVLVDDGQYEQSWKEAAKLFQDTVTSTDWQTKARAERDQLGTRESRKLKEIKSASAVKGLPTGQYVQVKYQSAYAKKKTATETVIAVLESDGTWRVAAYSIN